MAPPRGWEPLQIWEGEGSTMMAKEYAESAGLQHHYEYRIKQRAVHVKSFRNRLYNGECLIFADGSAHIEFKRNDRAAVRDWRHFQAIKNEVIGLDREAVEIFPPEMELVDAANQYHLWVLPPGVRQPWGFECGYAATENPDTHDHALYRVTGKSGARQRDFENGIPTGPPLADQIIEAARQLLAKGGWTQTGESDG